MTTKLTAALAGLVLFGFVGTGVAQPMKSMEGVMGGPVPQMMQPMMRMVQACTQIMAQMGGMGGMAPEPKTQPLEGRDPTEHGTKQAGGLEVTLLSSLPLSPDEMRRMMPSMGGTGRMQGTGGMMPGMQGMMRGMSGMGGMGRAEAPPTHWIGVIVRDLTDGKVAPDLHVTLTAQKGGLTRTVALMPMPGSYGTNISLPEKGRYTVMVTIDRPGQSVRVAFEFDYK